MKLSKEIREQLSSLGNDRNIWIEGSILKLLDDCDGEFKEYIITAVQKDSERRKKRLEITKQVQEKNKELSEKADENENLMVELKEALQTAESAKEEALSDLDIVRYALWVIGGTGIITTALYAMAIMAESSETTLIGNTWSNLFGILLTNSFSIIGTVMGVKYANKDED
jgi:hypothetical protein